MQQKDVSMPSQTKALIVTEIFAAYMTTVGIASAEPEPEPTGTDGVASPGLLVDPEDEDARNAASLEAYRDQRYSDAMRAFEALWQDFGRVKYLYNAAISHEVLGHDAQAYVYFRRCLAHAELSADMRAEIDERLNALRRRTVLLRIQSVADLRAPGARVELYYRSLHGLTDPERAPLTLAKDVATFLDEHGDVVFYVERGLWGASVAEPGHRIESGTIEISGARIKTVVLAVSRPRVPAAWDKRIALTVDSDIHEERHRWALELRSRRLALGLGTVSALTFAGGTIMAVYSGVRWSDELGEFIVSSDFQSRNSALKRMDGPLTIQIAGASVGGGGLGLGITSLIAVKPRRPRVWAGPLVLGAGTFAMGIFGTYSLYDSLVRDVTNRTKSGLAVHGEHASFHTQQATVLLASAAIGVGAGLMVGGVVGIIHSAAGRRWHALRYSVTPQVSAAGAAFVLRGRF
jgi:hypothetical protein